MRLETYRQYDLNLMSRMQHLFRSNWLDRWVPCLTQLGGTAAVSAGTLLLSLIKQDRGFAILVLLISHLVVHFLKKMFARTRPYEAFQACIELRSEKMPDHSFPSGHTAAAWTLATQVVMSFPALAIIAIPIAAFVGWSRMYLGLHYPSDVIAGGLIGCLVPMLISSLI